VIALQPFPDSQLGEPSEPGPEAAYDLAESVNLAFLTAVQLLPARHVREMDFTGRPMKGMVFVEPDGLNGPALGHWVAEAAAFAGSLPAKA
jgi:hypothetical protein